MTWSVPFPVVEQSLLQSGTCLRPLLPVLVLAGLAGGCAGLATTPAKADLRVCNQTSNSVSIAMGYRAPRGWQSEGWWVAPPAKCATVFEGDLNSRYYYLYVADDIGGGAWDGTVRMCIRDETFTIFGVEDCLARGYEPVGFFEVDTENRQDWTLQLTEGDAAGAAPTEDDAPLDGVDPNDQPADLPADDVPLEEETEP